MVKKITFCLLCLLCVMPVMHASQPKPGASRQGESIKNFKDFDKIAKAREQYRNSKIIHESDSAKRVTRFSSEVTEIVHKSEADKI